tara:strand:- start:24 stop:353 length:330 start_codon:yes stop_codon:yes gene_type:complete
MLTIELYKMPILTTISGIPVYTTIEEALAWAGANGLSGYHIRNYKGQVGYMGGSTSNALTISGKRVVTQSTTQNQATMQRTTQNPTITRTTTSVRQTNVSPSTGSGGGY